MRTWKEEKKKDKRILYKGFYVLHYIWKGNEMKIGNSKCIFHAENVAWCGASAAVVHSSPARHAFLRTELLNF